MALLAHRVRRADPGPHFVVDLARAKTQAVPVIARRIRLDLVESRTVDPLAEHESDCQVVVSHHHRDERHPEVKGDARLLRDHGEPPTGLHFGRELVEQSADRRRPLREMRVEWRPAATKVRLVLVGECPPAFGAAPERFRHDVSGVYWLNWYHLAWSRRRGLRCASSA